MSGVTLALLASGMVTPVGMCSVSACAAIRAGLNNFAESSFRRPSGSPIIAAMVPFLEASWGIARLVQLVEPAIGECLAWFEKNDRSIDASQIPLILSVSEPSFPGRHPDLQTDLLPQLQKKLGYDLHHKSALVPHGRVGGAIALQIAHNLIEQKEAPYCIVAGVDSFLTASTINAYLSVDRLKTKETEDGFIPGEAGAAVLVGSSINRHKTNLIFAGLGMGAEKAIMDSEHPMRGEGLLTAIRSALSDSQNSMNEMDYRISDVNGEPYAFKESTLAFTRALGVRKDTFDFWMLADKIGDVGAAVVPCMLSVAFTADIKKYAAGPVVLIHASSEGGERAAIILKPKL